MSSDRDVDAKSAGLLMDSPWNFVFSDALGDSGAKLGVDGGDRGQSTTFIGDISIEDAKGGCGDVFSAVSDGSAEVADFSGALADIEAKTGVVNGDADRGAGDSAVI